MAKKASGAGKKLSVDDLTKELLETKPKNSRDPRKWLEKGGEINVLDDGTWVYTNAKGQSVKYTNGFPDFKEAGLVQQEVNIMLMILKKLINQLLMVLAML